MPPEAMWIHDDVAWPTSPRQLIVGEERMLRTLEPCR